MTEPEPEEQVVRIRRDPVPSKSADRLGERMSLTGYDPPVLAEPQGGPVPPAESPPLAEDADPAEHAARRIVSDYPLDLEDTT